VFGTFSFWGPAGGVGMSVVNCTRPALRWHGGKWLLAPWIISHFPPHRVYVEPYGGAMSVLIRKPRSYAEIYNDLDADVVNLFRVLRGPHASELIHILNLTPFARDEFLAAYIPTNCNIERARNLVTRSFMGFGSDGHNGARPTGFRANSNRSGTTPTHDWVNFPESLSLVVSRIQGVTIENRDAMQVMAAHDGPETLHYVDPPYVHATRAKAHNSSMKNYTHEMDDDDHEALLVFLKTLSGAVVLSGYDHPIYESALKDWRRETKASLADGARPRIETLWINEAASQQVSLLTLMASA
jgi:DNA adenine methylase